MGSTEFNTEGPGGEGGVLGISSDGDDRMELKVKTQKIPRASSKTQKNYWTKNKPPKNPMPILWPLKVNSTIKQQQNMFACNLISELCNQDSTDSI